MSSILQTPYISSEPKSGAAQIQKTFKSFWLSKAKGKVNLLQEHAFSRLLHDFQEITEEHHDIWSICRSKGLNTPLQYHEKAQMDNSFYSTRGYMSGLNKTISFNKRCKNYLAMLICSELNLEDDASHSSMKYL